MTGRKPLELYLDGALVGRGELELAADPAGFVTKIGYCSNNFPRPSGFKGSIDEVRIYNRRLSPGELKGVGESGATQGKGLVGYWRFENGAVDSSGSGNDGTVRGAAGVEGKAGKGLRFGGKDMVLLPASAGEAVKNEFWTLLARDFPDPQAQKEMAQERRDAIWDRDWRPGAFGELAARYVQACTDEGQKAKAAQAAKEGDSALTLWKIRAAYHAPPPLRVPAAIPLDTDPHLVGWWKFDETSGQTAADSSKHKRTGALAGGLSFDRNAVAGTFMRALKFDGGSGSIDITGYKGIGGTRPRTVAVWIKTDTSRGELLSWGSDDFGKMWIVGFVRGRVGVVPKGGYLYVNDVLSDGKWHHVAVVVEEAEAPNLHDNVKLYQDGAPATIHDIGLLDLWPLETGAEQDVRIGRGFKGLIDDVRIYDRVLSGDEIKALFAVKTTAQ